MYRQIQVAFPNRIYPDLTKEQVEALKRMPTVASAYIFPKVGSEKDPYKGKESTIEIAEKENPIEPKKRKPEQLEIPKEAKVTKKNGVAEKE